jgi:transposase
MTENMTREQAETVTREIREQGKALTTARTKFASAVKRAKQGNAHAALGFKSWTAYVADTFENLPGLGKADHEYLTAYMAGEGMSSRAVARVLGVSQSTAARMIRQAEEKGEVSADREVEGTDGKGQKADKKGGREKGEGKKSDETTGKREVSVKQADTDTLRTLMAEIAGELSDRWAEGDEAAEKALREIADMLVLA